MYNKVDFGASDFEAAVLLQIEVKRKMLGRSVTFEPRSVEKHFQQQNFFELTTPSNHISFDSSTVGRGEVTFVATLFTFFGFWIFDAEFPTCFDFFLAEVASF